MPGELGNPHRIGQVYDEKWVITGVVQEDPHDPGLPYLYETRDIHTGESYTTEYTDGVWIDPGSTSVRDATPAELHAIRAWFWHADLPSLPNA